MAAPTFVSFGSGRQTTGLTVSATWGTHQEDDIGLLLCHSRGITTPVPTPSGWTAISAVNQVETSGNQRLQVFYKIATSSSEPDFTVNNPNTALNTRIIVYRGASLTDPVNVAIDGEDSVASAGTISYPSVTTTGNDRRIVLFQGVDDNNATANPLSNSNLSPSPTTHRITLNANSQTYAILDSTVPTAGAIGATTGNWTGVESAKTIYGIVVLQEQDPVFPEDLELFEFTPVQTGYTGDMGNAVIEIPLEGGASRKFQDILLPPHLLNLQWILRATEYTKFMGFFTTELKFGRDSFLIELITDIGFPTPHRVTVLGNGPKLTRQSGDAYFVSCTVQVHKNPTFTGNINYLEEGHIVFTTHSPSLGQLITAGDTIQVCFSSGIHPTGNTPLNLDGRYVVAQTVGNSLVLYNPELINSDWNVLAGLGVSEEYGTVSKGNVTSTVFRLPDPIE